MKVVGFILAFLGSSIQSLGLVLQKKAQNAALEGDRARLSEKSIWEDSDSDNEHEGGEEESSIAYVKSKWWIVGFSLHTMGSICSFVSIGMIGPALFVVIATFGLVANLIFSSRILYESVYKKDYLAIFVIAVGISLCITAKETATHSDPLNV